MKIHALPADAVIVAGGGAGLLVRPLDQLDGLQRQRGEPLLPGRGVLRQPRVHPGPSHGHPRPRQAAAHQRERPRRRGAASGCPTRRKTPGRPQQIPEKERFYFLEERYPTYGNLVPRDIATRELFNVCFREGLSVERDRPCVYLDVTQLPRETLDRKLGGVLDIYQKFQGADPRTTPMKIFPAVHYTMGGLWCDYERSAGRRAGRRLAPQPADQYPGAVRHRRMRISVSRRQPPGGQLAGGLHLQRPDRRAGRDPLHRQPAARDGDRAALVAVRPARRCGTWPTTGPCWPGPKAARTPIASMPNWGA